MNMYYFGDSLEYIEAEYATSNRSTCRTCKQKINKDQLRLGLILDDDHFNAKYWYHLKCFQLKPRHKEMKQDQIEQKIYNIDRLQDQDYKAVVQHIKSELNRLKSGKKASKKATKKQSKKGSKKQSKKKNKDQSSEQQSYQSSSQSEQSSQSSSQQSGKKKRAKSKGKSKSKKAAPTINVYTKAQQQQYNKLLQKYEGMKADDLKLILAKNNQSKNGTKSQLAAKCADGKILGQIPKCQSCGGGRPRFDKQTGKYSCPGFMEDTDFKHCGKKYQFNEVKRLQWVQ